MAYNTPYGQDAVSGTVVVAAATASPRAITVQLKDAAGANIDYVETVEVTVFTSIARTAYVVTGGSTGLAIGASGALLPIVAKKHFLAQTTAAGLLALTHTDTGTDACYLGVRLPNGEYIMADRAHTIGT
jgi:hypothetical protein